jgi:hypothetical protein
MDLSNLVFAQELARLKELLGMYQQRLDELSEYRGARLTTAGSYKGVPNIYIKMPGEKEYRYARRADAGLVENIRKCRVYEQAVKDISENIRGIEKNQKVLISCDPASILERVAPVYRGGMEDFFSNLTGNARSWIQASEERYRSQDPFKPEGLLHNCGGGLMVRSKSEAIIVAALRRKGIPFFYELELDIGGFTYHPDFTLYSEKLGRVIIWEHHGKRNDVIYMADARKKVSHYMRYGWLPGENLILTYDDVNGGIDIGRIYAKIEEYF